MTVFLQIVTLAIIIVASVGWGRWVWESNRPIDAPEQLSPILVHGLPEADATLLADAAAVGIIGRIAEHTRTVAFINEAAAVADSSIDIKALTRVSQPAPSMIGAAHTPKALDIAIEFAGAKVDTKGLQRLFRIDSQKRGALSISLLLEKHDKKFEGLASSSFPSNNAYGFAVPIEGNTQKIAETIAMRFVQAHYAAVDSFYTALDPKDFQTLWKIRKRAAQIALRASGGGTGFEKDPLKDEAQAAYREIAPLVRRYTRRPEFQRLGAYLASVSENYEQAKTHLQLIKRWSQDKDERSMLDRMIASLETDASVQLATASPPPAADTSRAAQIGVSESELRILEEPTLVEVGATTLASKVRSTGSARSTDIVLVLGAFDAFEPFVDRITPLSDQDHDPDDSLLPHTQSIAALIATLAPRARIRVVRALSGDGSGAKADVIAAVHRAVAANPELIVLPLGPFDTQEERSMLELAGKQSLVLVAAGNSGQRLPRSDIDLPGVIFVGATVGDERAPYSNYGESVDIFAPGSVLTFDGDGRFQRANGTSFSVAIAAAAAANLAALETARLAPAELGQRLLANTTLSKKDRLLRLPAN